MKVKILVIDDESEIRNLLKEVLLTEGYDIEVTSNGEEALEIVKKNGPFDIVLTPPVKAYHTKKDVSI